MIDYATFQRIQHLHCVEQLTVAQIAHAIALDARTVRRWLDEPRFRPRLCGARPSKLDPYKAYIRRLLEHHPYSAAQILNRLREAGYVGGATIVKDYLQRVRPVRAPAFLTLHFAPGECAQVDWGHYGSVNVGNPRFLILPWIHIPSLGSHILAIVRRRLPQDWTERYNTTPALIETFVETPRYTGAVYRASGWLHVGTTQGRGRYDRDKLFDKPRKDVWLRPSEKIGNEPSIGRINLPSTARQNAHE